MQRGSWAFRGAGFTAGDRNHQRSKDRTAIGSHGSKATRTAPATKDTKCQRCEKFGHYTADCTSAPIYKSRPTRTQQLLKPSKQPKLLSAADSFSAPSREGVAAKILEDNADERERAKRARSSSASSSDDTDSDTDSDSDSSSEADPSDRNAQSPPRKSRRTDD